MEGGLHWVGLFYSLIHFPATHKSIEFSDDPAAQSRQLSTRTKEGLELKLHFAFQYKLKKDELPEMYRMLQNDYEQVFTRIARNSVLHVAGDYIAPQYWLQRAPIGGNMTGQLKHDMGEAHAEVSGFMLLKIDLPDVYEGAIVATEVTNQEITLYETLRAVNQTQTETENIKATALARITRIDSDAASRATVVLNQGAGDVAKQNIDYTTDALNEVQKKLNFTDPRSSLLDYYRLQRISALKDDTNNRLVIGNTTATMTLTQ